MSFDVDQIRGDFPILQTAVNGQPIAYLDSAATSQKPQQVLDRVDQYWREENANVHRGVHILSQRATKAYEGSREKVRQFLGAESLKEIIFTKGCTEAINLVAAVLPLTKDDVVLISTMEHHSNIVPWQMTGAKIKPIPVTDEGEIDLGAYTQLLKGNPVKVVAIVHISNSLGTINPIKEMTRMAHDAGALVLVDGAQAGPHLEIDVQNLDADFYTLSCHKIYAPTGVGVLYGKEKLLNELPPYQGGGDMIRTVAIESSTYADLPAKYEAGTPNIGGVVGLGAAIDYLASQDRKQLQNYEDELTKHATEELLKIEGVSIKGNVANKASVISFLMADAHPHDIGTILDGEGVGIRTGHHCCMPLMTRFKIPATARASFAFYNTHAEVERLIEGVKKVKGMFA